MDTAPLTLPCGTHHCAIRVGKRQRSYIVYVPSNACKERAWPVLLAFHGSGTNAELMMSFCGLNEKAERAGFLVVYPNGSGRTPQALSFNAGNCCGYAMREQVDDIAFVDAILADLAARTQICSRRIFATGMSNGAVMCYSLASQPVHRVAAVAPVAGPVGQLTCSATRPVPVCHFHGTDDAFAPYGGGRGRRSISKTRFFSVAQSIDLWVQTNNCQADPVRTVLPCRVDDGTRIIVDAFSGGRGGSEVVLYTIEGGGHTWPGRPASIPMLGKSTANLSANDVMWEFFERHGG